MGIRIDIKEKDLKILLALLQQFLPNTLVWAFGSRVKFTAKPTSDLDLVAFINEAQKMSFSLLKDALAESDLPFRVDLHDWNDIPENFKKNIEGSFVVIQNEKVKEFPNNWKVFKLGDFAEINPKISLKQGQVYSFVEMKDLDATYKYVSPSIKKELRGGSKFQNGDTLFARITPCLENGKICQVKNLENNLGFGSTEFLVFRGRENVSDSDFVYYLSRSEFVKNNAIQLMTGSSGRQRVEKSTLAELEIIVPNDIETQILIAQTLSSLDDKIELNLQINQTLEAMAQALFKEWFVDFKFPGFDGVLVDGLPRGWRMGKVKEMYKTTSGGTPSRAKEEYYIDGVINWVKSKELNGNFIFDTEEKITETAVNNSSTKIIPRHSVLLAMYGATVGEYAITAKETTCNQAICAVIENGSYPFTYFFEFFKINKNSIIGQASGSAQQNISQALIQQLDILVPPIEVVREYHSIVESMFIKMESNLSINQTLIETRDTLLPRLMSGRIKTEK